MPPLPIQKKFPPVCLLDIVPLLSLSFLLHPPLLHSLSLSSLLCLSASCFFLSLFLIFVLPFMSPRIIVVFESPYLTTLFFLFLTLCLSLLQHFCPSLSLLDKTTHRLDELMMCSGLNLPSLHIHHNIYHILIYFLGDFTYSKISK